MCVKTEAAVSGIYSALGWLLREAEARGIQHSTPKNADFCTKFSVVRAQLPCRGEGSDFLPERVSENDAECCKGCSASETSTGEHK